MSADALLPLKPPVLTTSSFSDCITHCITSTQCTRKKKPRLRNLAKPGLLSERRTKVRTGDPELGKVMRGALFPPTWRICWVQDAHYAHGRAGCAGDLHQERISGGPDAVGLGGAGGGDGVRREGPARRRT